MGQTWMYRLFGVGKIKPERRSELDREGIVLLEEGIGGSATYRNFRSPGRAYSWRKTWGTAALVLTRERIYAEYSGTTVVNVPFSEPRLREVQFTVEGNGGTFCVALDASLFHIEWAGRMEYRFRTDKAQQFLSLIRQSVENPVNWAEN